MAVYNLGTIPNAASERAKALGEGISGIVSIVSEVRKAQALKDIETQKTDEATKLRLMQNEQEKAKLASQEKIEAAKETAATQRQQMRDEALIESRHMQSKLEQDRKENALADKMHQNYSNMAANDPKMLALFKKTEGYKHAVKFIKRVKGNDVVDAKGDLIPLPPQGKAESIITQLLGGNQQGQESLIPQPYSTVNQDASSLDEADPAGILGNR